MAKDRVLEAKKYRQRILDKLELETSEVETLMPGSSKEKYLRVLEDKIAQLKAMVDEMTEKSKIFEKELRKEYEQDIKLLEERFAATKTKLEDIRQSSGDAWKELHTGALNALRELGDGIKNAISKF